MLKSELIEQNKNLIIQNGELLYLLEFGKLKCEYSNGQMIWEHDSNARVLKYRIDKAIEYIEENKNKTYAPYGDNEDYDYEVCLDEDEIKYLLKLLKGDNND